MANTYTQIHLHVVFAVRFRESLIADAWKEELYRYISGILRGNGHKLLAINGMPDHVHLFSVCAPCRLYPIWCDR